MDRLYFKTSRAYDLYEEGTSVIRLDRLADWAHAFGLSEREFADAVLEPSQSEPRYSLDDMRAELQAAGLPDDLIAEALDTGRDQPALSRKGVARAFLQWHAKHGHAERGRRRTG